MSNICYILSKYRRVELKAETSDDLVVGGQEGVVVVVLPLTARGQVLSEVELPSLSDHPVVVNVIFQQTVQRLQLVGVQELVVHRPDDENQDPMNATGNE